MFYGAVLTHVPTFETLVQYKHKYKFDAMKAVESWGLPWNGTTRAQFLALTGNPIIRTTAGDPSNPNAYKFLNWEKVLAELEPWLAIKPDLMVELGNEPNIKPTNDQDIFGYRYYLIESIAKLREKYKYAHIIAPAFIVNEYMPRWFDILKPAFEYCDSVALHMYEHYGFIGKFPAKTDHFNILHQLYNGVNKPRIITEFGINDKNTSFNTKMLQYLAFINELENKPEYAAKYRGAVAYHINTLRDIDPQYAIPV